MKEFDLSQFIGSEQWFRHGLNREVLYTEGAQYVAEQCGAYWLLDEIALAQLSVKAVAREPFQAWKLAVNVDYSATLACEDGNNRVVYSKRITFTDFPLKRITLWFINDTILLPSEY